MPQVKQAAQRMSSMIQESGASGLAVLISLKGPFNYPSRDAFRRLNFAIYVRKETTKEDLACTLCAVGQHVQYPHSDFPIVVIVIGETFGRDLNRLKPKINISRDIVEPLLPPNAPKLRDNPKIFFVNIYNFWGELTYKKFNSLHLPSEGNYILFHSESEKLHDVFSVNADIERELRHNHGSIEEVMEAIDSPSTTIVSHLNKPVFIHTLSKRIRVAMHPGSTETHARPISPLSMSKRVHVEGIEQGLQSLALQSPFRTHDTKTVFSQSEFDRNIQLMVSTEEEKFLPGSRGMAFVVGISNEHLSQLSDYLVKEHVTLLSQTFHTLGFAVFEKIGTTKAVLKDIVSKSSNLPNSQDYPIVLVVAGTVYQSSINTSDSSDRNVNIRKDIVEPFLPPLAPHIADNPKIFLINTFASPSELTPLATADLDLLSEGNFLLSYTHTDHFSDLSKTYQYELIQSTDSLEEVLIRVNDKLSLLSTKRLISRLTKPVHLVLVDQASTSKE